ncbi:LuxR C-terminal-related transcriptional regulator [Nocardiopsis exhalans]|uniref:LuxR C-terminal-related transcriptional regulator n=1 Tax=Nocardiopsis exhalans TaxID=163604 RepID=A0ABY5D559_9ACTN|nr:LuxR C-terminal-related transcriptional regulator [Nocardiopsis exhalans]USY19454.1 LuxR C-terminal-related transcriptional regulator [Nocardiopsis exhalans]
MSYKVMVSTSCSALNRRIHHATESAGWTAVPAVINGELSGIAAAVVESDQLYEATRYTDRGIPVIGIMYGTDDPMWHAPEIRELSGLVDRDDMDSEYTAALRSALGGRSHVSQEFAAHIISVIASRNALSTTDCTDLERLSAREREVVELAARGADNAEISATLKIEVSTVKFHISNILRKLEFRDRTELIVRLGVGLASVARPEKARA